MRNRDKTARPATNPTMADDMGLTKLEDLAMRLYVHHVTSPDCVSIESDELARESIKLANIFFDELDKREKAIGEGDE